MVKSFYLEATEAEKIMARQLSPVSIASLKIFFFSAIHKSVGFLEDTVGDLKEQVRPSIAELRAGVKALRDDVKALRDIQKKLEDMLDKHEDQLERGSGTREEMFPSIFASWREETIPNQLEKLANALTGNMAPPQHRVLESISVTGSPGSREAMPHVSATK